MNTRIRVLAFFLSLLLCLSLAACDQQPVPSETGGTTAGTDNSTTAADTPTTDNTPTVGIQIGTVDVQTLREGNWNTATVAEGTHDERFLSAEGGYYYLLNGFLYFYDPSSNVSVILCQKVGCLHEKEENYKIRKECEALLFAEYLLVYDSGYLYYDKDDRGRQLYRRNADGTGEKHIATLCESHIDLKHEAQMVSWHLSDGVLYYSVLVSTVEPDQNGTLLSKDAYHALMRLDLSTGKEKELLRTTNASISIIAAKNNAVLYNTMDLGYYQLPSADRVEGMFNTPVYTYLWTKEDGVSQELLCKPYRENLGIDGFDNGVITSSNYDTNTPYTYDLVTGEYRELSVPPNSVKLNEQLYLLEDQITIYNVQTDETLINEFADQCPTEFDMITFDFFASSNDGIMMSRSYYVENGASFTKKEKYISYVTFESLADGLHIQDAIEILSEKYGD